MRQGKIGRMASGGRPNAAKPSVAVDGIRTRKKAEHMLVCEKNDTDVSVLCSFASKCMLGSFLLKGRIFVLVIFTLRW